MDPKLILSAELLKNNLEKIGYGERKRKRPARFYYVYMLKPENTPKAPTKILSN